MSEKRRTFAAVSPIPHYPASEEDEETAESGRGRGPDRIRSLRQRARSGLKGNPGSFKSLGPTKNIAGAFPFLYPFVGIFEREADLFFCLTTSPEGFPSLQFHGAFRSRYIAGEAFFSLMRLLKFVGHPLSRAQCGTLGQGEHSYLFGFRRLPAHAFELWGRFFRGQSREALESLSLRLLDSGAARAKSAEIQEDLRALKRFFEEEASELALALQATGYAAYPVPQRDRDPLFLQYREGAKR